jgi:hypothetical protein
MATYGPFHGVSRESVCARRSQIPVSANHYPYAPISLSRVNHHDCVTFGSVWFDRTAASGVRQDKFGAGRAMSNPKILQGIARDHKCVVFVRSLLSCLPHGDDRLVRRNTTVGWIIRGPAVSWGFSSARPYDIFYLCVSSAPLRRPTFFSQGRYGFPPGDGPLNPHGTEGFSQSQFFVPAFCTRMAASALTESMVAHRQGRYLLTTFHPELTGDSRFHECFVQLPAS